MTPSLITNAEQATQDWLYITLQHGGYLHQIASFSKTVSNPFGSTLVWIKVTYSGNITLPTAFLLKIEGPDSLAGEREVQFYTRYASGLANNATVPFFDAVYDPAQRAYHLLLADISATHYSIEREAPPTQAEAERMIDTLAALHAFWWDKLPTELEAVDAGLLNDQPFDFGGFVDFMGERMTAKRRAIYERILTALPGLLQKRFEHGQAQTLVHDDAHTWNFMQPRDAQQDRAILVDWQQWGRSVGPHDVAYMITLFWYPEHRQNQELSMVKRYHRRLLEAGVSGYTWDDCWQDYRLYTLRNMLVPLWAWGWGHWAPHRWMQMEKSIFAFHDLDCEELLG